MEDENAAEKIMSTLAAHELTLGLVECGTNGVVSRQLFDTEDGPAVLGDSLNVNTVEEAVDFLGLPWQQFGRAGDFSAKAARAAARAGREVLEVNWCLAVWSMPLAAGAAIVHEMVHLALNTGQDLLDETLRYEGPADGMADWLAAQASDFMIQVILHSP